MIMLINIDQKCRMKNSDYTWNNINDNQIIMDDNWFYKYN